ncbi:MAG: molybdopterin converting factor subunit 1 [Nitrososphaerales archaeon]|jgi:molybdopterin converting factor subunit 1
MTRFRILYFAQTRKAAGVRSEEITLDGTPTVSLVVEKAIELHPPLRKLRDGMRVAVNEEVVSDAEIVRDGDRVALIPPIVGG